MPSPIGIYGRGVDIEPIRVYRAPLRLLINWNPSANKWLRATDRSSLVAKGLLIRLWGAQGLYEPT
jgi:hypothetical protein